MTDPIDTAETAPESVVGSSAKATRRTRTAVPPPDAATVLAAIAAAAEADAARQDADDGSEGGGRRANRGVWIRAFIYVIGFHVFAAFVMLLFYFGGRNH
jgi:hypothetical protein